MKIRSVGIKTKSVSDDYKLKYQLSGNRLMTAD